MQSGSKNNGLLYFVEGDYKQIHLSDLQGLGLGYAFERDPDFCPALQNTPSGTPGITVSQCDDVACRVKPGQQDWMQIPQSLLLTDTRVWVGKYSDAEVVESGLRRKEMLPYGHWVTCADGTDWRVPIARKWNVEDGELKWWDPLPPAMSLDENGKWRFSGVQARYKALWDIAEKYFEPMYFGSDIGDSQEDELENIPVDAVAALQMNYRIGHTECALLGLFDPITCRNILQAVIDWPTAHDFLKKNATKTVTEKDTHT